MWVIVIIGLVFEAVAIALAWSEDGTLIFSWICSGIATVIVWAAFHFDKNHDANFLVVLILMFAISQIPLIIKVAVRKNKHAREEAEKQRKIKQEEIEDENRILAHMGMIRRSVKHTEFLNFLKNHTNRIIRINVDSSGQVVVRLSNSNPIFVPDYKAGRMVMNKPYDHKDYYFFGTANNERNWTVFEAEALARVIDEDMKSLRGFFCVTKRNGYREYGIIVPDKPVYGKTPY